MTRILLTTAAAIAFLLSAGTVSAQKLDANGRCHSASGQFAKAEVCGGAASLKATKSAKAAPAMAAMSATPAAAAKAEKCRDDKGHFIKCGAAPAAAAMSAKAPAAPAAAAMSAKAPAAKAARCKNAKGKFAKCGSPGATPA